MDPGWPQPTEPSTRCCLIGQSDRGWEDKAIGFLACGQHGQELNGGVGEVVPIPEPCRSVSDIVSNPSSSSSALHVQVG